MIHIARNVVTPPEELNSSFVRQSLVEAEAFYNLSSRTRNQRRFELSLVPIYEPVKAALQKMCHNKCVYCEVETQGLQGFIEHYRPPRNALGDDGETYLAHYWWLTFKWDNLLLACAECNRMKGNRFPIAGPRAEILAGSSSLKAEAPSLLNPCVDKPEMHLAFGDNGLLFAKSRKGETTLKVLGLNRTGLVETRKQLIDLFRRELTKEFRPNAKELRAFLTKSLSPNLPFLGLRRSIIRGWLEKWLDDTTANELRETLVAFSVVPVWLPISQFTPSDSEDNIASVESSDWREKRSYYAQLRTVERIEIKNFKGISQLDIKIPPPASSAESWVMFLGENGTGKSSVLQAIALALLGQDACDGLRLDARQFVRRGSYQGSVRVWLTNSKEPVVLTFNSAHRRFHVSPPEPAILLMGFGATRLLRRPHHKQAPSQRSNRVKNLFDPFARLNHAERWLTDRSAVKDDRFNRIAIALRKLLMLTDDHQFSRSKNEVWVNLHGNKIPLSQLSDGYQCVVAMAINIIMGVIDRWKEIELAEGVILVDELEVHLHPIWKMEIVGLLRQTFPKMMFLASTHDPLCLRGLLPGEIIVLRFNGEEINPQVVNEPLAHLRADQLLTSPLFGLLGTREPAAADKLKEVAKRYDELFIKENRTADEETELLKLRAEINRQTPSGESPESRFVEKAVRQAVQNLAKEPVSASEQSTIQPLVGSESAKAAIREKIAELLSEDAK